MADGDGDGAQRRRLPRGTAAERAAVGTAQGRLQPRRLHRHRGRGRRGPGLEWDRNDERPDHGRSERDDRRAHRAWERARREPPAHGQVHLGSGAGSDRVLHQVGQPVRVATRDADRPHALVRPTGDVGHQGPRARVQHEQRERMGRNQATRRRLAGALRRRHRGARGDEREDALPRAPCARGTVGGAGKVRDGERHRDRGERLHRHLGHAHVRSGRDREDRQRPGDRRRRSRQRRAVQAQAPRPARANAQRRDRTARRLRHHPQHRGARGAVRAKPVRVHVARRRRQPGASGRRVQRGGRSIPDDHTVGDGHRGQRRERSPPRRSCAHPRVDVLHRALGHASRHLHAGRRCRVRCGRDLHRRRHGC